MANGKTYFVDRFIADRVHVLPLGRDSADRILLINALLEQSPLGFRCAAEEVVDACHLKTFGVPRGDVEIVSIAIAQSIEERRPLELAHIVSAAASAAYESKARKIGVIYSAHPDDLKRHEELWPPFESDVAELLPTLKAKQQQVVHKAAAARYVDVTGATASNVGSERRPGQHEPDGTQSGRRSPMEGRRSAKVVRIREAATSQITPEESMFSPSRMFNGERP
jgi:hypothetical protein